jgi:hypothetical protein
MIWSIDKMKAKHDQQKLEAFFREVAKLTSDHDVLLNEYAVVFPSKLGKALEKVDENWWRIKVED